MKQNNFLSYDRSKSDVSRLFLKNFSFRDLTLDFLFIVLRSIHVFSVTFPQGSSVTDRLRSAGTHVTGDDSRRRAKCGERGSEGRDRCGRRTVKDFTWCPGAVLDEGDGRCEGPRKDEQEVRSPTRFKGTVCEGIIGTGREETSGVELNINM